MLQFNNPLGSILSLPGISPETRLQITTVEQDLVRTLTNHGPIDLFLFRHIESEGNEAHKRQREGTLTEAEAERLKETVDWKFRSTPRGGKQAKALGQFIEEQNLHFDRIFCSGFFRTRETAGGSLIETKYKNFPISLDYSLEERSYGRHHEQPAEKMHVEGLRRLADARDWIPKGGSSLRTTTLEARAFLDKLHDREYLRNASVAAFTHGEKIIALRSIIERWMPEQLGQELDKSMPNGSFIQYSRCDPDTGVVKDDFCVYRQVLPHTFVDKQWPEWDGAWKRVERRKYTAQELLERAEQVPRFLEY